ncbi:hypothetical protein JW824_13855 [bacterium]|nr:hypothetical protein [bacterium]
MRKILKGFSRPDVEKSTNALDCIKITEQRIEVKVDLEILKLIKENEKTDKIIDNKVVVKNASRVIM